MVVYKDKEGVLRSGTGWLRNAKKVIPSSVLNQKNSIIWLNLIFEPLNLPSPPEQTHTTHVTDRDTEQRIFEAATAVFHERGYHGARMQEIARRAEINASMLHYYYRSKDRLFEAVFHRSARQVIEPVLEAFRAERPLLDKVERFVDTYITLVLQHPHVPGFILEELRRNPARLRTFVGAQSRGVFAGIAADVEAAARRGDIRPIAPEQFVVNLLALCVFPFVARPMIQTLTGLDDDAYPAFLESRKREVVRFIVNALTP